MKARCEESYENTWVCRLIHTGSSSMNTDRGGGKGAAGSGCGFRWMEERVLSSCGGGGGDSEGKLCVWDVSGSSVLRVFRTADAAPGAGGGGSPAAPHTLVTLHGSADHVPQHVLAAQTSKPIIDTWLFGPKEQRMRMVCPGRVRALTATPDGVFCVGAVEEKLHVWQVSTGDLLAVVARHFRPVTCLKTTDDGARLISAGEDCLVIAWKMATLVSLKQLASQMDPLHTWDHHSLPVTDVHVGSGGRKARVATAAMDHTCRLYDLPSGVLLLTVVLEVGLTAVVMDPVECFLYAGACDGRIFRIDLVKPSSGSSSSSSFLLHPPSRDSRDLFKGHKKKVTALAMAGDAHSLVSASDDAMVIIWDIHTGQNIRTLKHSGPVTNLLLLPPSCTDILLPNIARSVDRKSSLAAVPQIHVARFQGQLCTSGGLSGGDSWTHCVHLPLGQPPPLPSDAQSWWGSDVITGSALFYPPEQQQQQDRGTDRELRDQLNQLKTINEKLIEKAVAEFIDDQ